MTLDALYGDFVLHIAEASQHGQVARRHHEMASDRYERLKAAYRQHQHQHQNQNQSQIRFPLWLLSRTSMHERVALEDFLLECCRARTATTAVVLPSNGKSNLAKIARLSRLGRPFLLVLFFGNWIAGSVVAARLVCAYLKKKMPMPTPTPTLPSDADADADALPGPSQLQHPPPVSPAFLSLYEGALRRRCERLALDFDTDPGIMEDASPITIQDIRHFLDPPTSIPMPTTATPMSTPFTPHAVTDANGPGRQQVATHNSPQSVDRSVERCRGVARCESGRRSYSPSSDGGVGASHNNNNDDHNDDDDDTRDTPLIISGSTSPVLAPATTATTSFPLLRYTIAEGARDDESEDHQYCTSTAECPDNKSCEVVSDPREDDDNSGNEKNKKPRAADQTVAIGSVHAALMSKAMLTDAHISFVAQSVFRSAARQTDDADAAETAAEADYAVMDTAWFRENNKPQLRKALQRRITSRRVKWLLVPVHQPALPHWMLAFVDLDDGGIFWYDSLHSSDQEEWGRSTFVPFVASADWWTHDETHFSVTDGPTQTDGTSCGVWVLCAIWRWISTRGQCQGASSTHASKLPGMPSNDSDARAMLMQLVTDFAKHHIMTNDADADADDDDSNHDDEDDVHLRPKRRPTCPTPSTSGSVKRQRLDHDTHGSLQDISKTLLTYLLGMPTSLDQLPRFAELVGRIQDGRNTLASLEGARDGLVEQISKASANVDKASRRATEAKEAERRIQDILASYLETHPPVVSEEEEDHYHHHEPNPRDSSGPIAFLQQQADAATRRCEQLQEQISRDHQRLHKTERDIRETREQVNGLAVEFCSVLTDTIKDAITVNVRGDEL
ncbi:hypothetical protein EKO27_g25 [Xylaria grammica]|uniref:Ubiquitin-like protease family profile domain-containing protein n=1 Tax=Xylaria grammica TaxID=363999 RepID=A0A439DKR0_9PEZI|nr:hypothetical protein EKO27_g25 [Xylaria grammica]